MSFRISLQLTLMMAQNIRKKGGKKIANVNQKYNFRAAAVSSTCSQVAFIMSTDQSSSALFLWCSI